MTQRVEISYKTVVFIAVFCASLWLLWQIKTILLMIFIGYILSSALNPLVDKFESWKLPRFVGIIIIYVILWLVIGGILAGLIPPLVEETRHLISILPQSIAQSGLIAKYQQEISQQFLSRISVVPENLLRFTVGFFGNLVNILTTLVITFYLLLERKNFPGYINNLLAKNKAEFVNNLMQTIETSLGGWVRGELILMLAVGLATYIGLTIIGVDSALPLAILAGTLELVPTFGPTLSMIPAILLALSENPWKALGVGILYYLVQLVENNVLVPNVMKQAVGVNPLISILSLMIGFTLAGPVGAVLAIPTVIIIKSIITSFKSK